MAKTLWVLHIWVDVHVDVPRLRGHVIGLALWENLGYCWLRLCCREQLKLWLGIDFVVLASARWFSNDDNWWLLVRRVVWSLRASILAWRFTGLIFVFIDKRFRRYAQLFLLKLYDLIWLRHGLSNPSRIGRRLFIMNHDNIFEFLLIYHLKPIFLRISIVWTKHNRLLKWIGKVLLIVLHWWEIHTFRAFWLKDIVAEDHRLIELRFAGTDVHSDWRYGEFQLLIIAWSLEQVLAIAFVPAHAHIHVLPILSARHYWPFIHLRLRLLWLWRFRNWKSSFLHLGPSLIRRESWSKLLHWFPWSIQKVLDVSIFSSKSTIFEQLLVYNSELFCPCLYEVKG